MDPQMELVVWVLAIAVLVSVAIFLGMWLRDRRRERREARVQLRSDVHRVRRVPSVSEIDRIRRDCGYHAIPYEDIGTHDAELSELTCRAYLDDARGLRASLCRDACGHLRKLDGIIRCLEGANQKHQWSAIGTTWEDLRDLTRKGMMGEARKIYENGVKLQDRGWNRQENMRAIEALLIYANGTLRELDPELTDAAWTALKEA